MRRLLVLSGLFVGVCAQADEPLCNSWKQCQSGLFYDVVKNDERCKTRMCSHEAPPLPQIYCFGGAGGEYQCEAWPRGDGLSYSWSAINGSVSMPGWNVFPYQQAYCGVSNQPLEVFVTVQSPFGLTSTRSVALSCTVGQVGQ